MIVSPAKAAGPAIVVAPIVARKYGTNVLLGTTFWGTNIALYPVVPQYLEVADQNTLEVLRYYRVLPSTRSTRRYGRFKSLVTTVYEPVIDRLYLARYLLKKLQTPLLRPFTTVPLGCA
jgi:hypothetical protein